MTPFERGEEAKRLLEHPVLREAFADIKRDIVAQLERVPFGDIDTQHHAVLALQALNLVQVRLEKYINDQKVQAHKVRQDTFIEKMKTQAKRFA